MLRSMTGYGHYEYQNEIARMSIEIKSVNHRYCDIYIRMPRQLNCFEDRIRSLISGQLSRGKLDVYINWEGIGEQAKEVLLDEGLARAYYQAMRKLSENLGLREDISASTLVRFPEIIRVEKQEQDEKIVWEILKNAVNQAVSALISMRENEGERLKKSLLDICEIIRNKADIIDKRAPFVVCEYKEKLQNRITELMESNTIDEMRLAMEVAVYADKCSIDEELVRLKSHLIQFVNVLRTEGPVGRKLDFLIQEMNREVNTIGSKANDMVVTQGVVDIKSEIEKLREQVQNIE